MTRFERTLRSEYMAFAKLETAARTQAEMVLALGADFPIRFEILFPNDGAAGAALGPQAFGADAALVHRGGILERFFFSFEPSHGKAS